MEQIGNSCKLIMQGQDYIIFIRGLVPFMANVLLKAWKESDDKSDMEILLNFMAFANDENARFKKEASKWSVSLTSVVPQKANLDYCRHHTSPLYIHS